MPVPQKFYTIRALAAPRRAEVFIFGDIGETWYGESVIAAEFVRDFAALDADHITVRISSYGGSVTDGIAIYNAIKRHPAETTVSIESVAASIASLIAMAGDTVEIAENARLMIHAPWGGMYGNATALREFADYLDGWAGAMATSYAQKTGKPLDEILTLLTDGIDHWYTATEAKDAGFADDITNAIPLAASLDLSRYKHSLPHAAAAVFIKQENSNMLTPIKTQAAEPQVPVAAVIAPNAQQSEAEIKAAVLADERIRRDAITASFKPFVANAGVNELLAICHNDTNCTDREANAKLLAHLGKGAESASGGYVAVIEDEKDKFRKGVANSLMARAGLAKDDGANQYRGYTAFELARASVERAGRSSNGMSKMEVVAAAFTHSNSDFPLLLANVAEKAMLKGYEEAEETFQKWTSTGVLPDFKAASRVDLNTFPSLQEVRPGAEYKSATVGERGETVQLATYGRMFSITRQAIINDDLNAFSKIPRSMGRAAIRTVGDLVYAVLTGNPNMSDGVALFHANHANLLTGAVISTASVDLMMAGMRRQKDATGNTLNVRMAYMLTPVTLEGAGRVVANSEFEVGASSKNNTTPNFVRGMFEVISDARLDTASTTSWYGAANPAAHDTIEVSYLDGVQTPTLEQQNGWSVDGVEFKVRLDAGVKALDWRTMQKNPN